jgi:hypothetical protein
VGEQGENLERVNARIGAAIVLFYHRQLGAGEREFHVEELRRFVLQTVGIIAPASPDRIMRFLRREGLIYYTVINRRKSLYRIDDPPNPPSWNFNGQSQGNLF